MTQISRKNATRFYRLRVSNREGVAIKEKRDQSKNKKKKNRGRGKSRNDIRHSPMPPGRKVVGRKRERENHAGVGTPNQGDEAAVLSGERKIGRPEQGGNHRPTFPPRHWFLRCVDISRQSI